jgi:pimeloyl-ACP methyl ester carboxylesterase
VKSQGRNPQSLFGFPGFFIFSFAFIGPSRFWENKLGHDRETRTKKKIKGKPLLVFIPGLGADPRLFYHQQKAFKNSFAPTWLAPQKDETLVHYARRWAQQLKLKKGCVLVGISFGGMVALEMVPIVKPRAVLLIGSCQSPYSVPLLLRVMGSLPGWPMLGKILARFFPYGRGWFLGVEKKEELDLLMKMFIESPDSFLQWTVKAIRGWEGFKGKGVKIRHIHGSQDRLIPRRNVKPDSVIKGGGHTIILTHPREVNGFIEKWSKRF